MENVKRSSRYLPEGIILNGKYRINEVIGEVGFGITYEGLDLDLEIPVAIKEFCPREYAGRNSTDRITILPYDKKTTEDFEREKDKFLYEAKRLAKFRSYEGVVSVLDFFRGNNTAYIVMEYIEGMTLKNYMKALGHPMEWKQVLDLMRPVMNTLHKIHEAGIIHRDISPDNIMISPDRKKVYLIDFGTAREVNEETLSAYRKSFYTPLEQRTGDGNQGPWTDIYALCVTMYQCITGKSVPMATDRMLGEKLESPCELGFKIPAYVEEALFHGMELKFENRTESMRLLEQELFQNDLPAEESTEDIQVEWNEEEEIPPTQERMDDVIIMRKNVVQPIVEKVDKRPEFIMNDIKKNEKLSTYLIQAFLRIGIGAVLMAVYLYIISKVNVIVHPVVEFVLILIVPAALINIPVWTMPKDILGKNFKKLFFDTHEKQEELNMSFARKQIEW
ncbi:MAG: serine/threonine protein kinase, partial [Lachnospiraceae bacterium]|nr:serine/threonine protein kinase [Lachnospiraceae bacterium]